MIDIFFYNFRNQYIFNSANVSRSVAVKLLEIIEF